ncbi:MAG TPA: hypothetical protein VKV28_12810 [Candidatus Binataceae bacterium]|nr:hypothetical protein [Candidatus Binataceae bacterium]
MIQFLMGLSSLNLIPLIGLVGGAIFYNSPPVAIFAAVIWLVRGGYGLRLPLRLAAAWVAVFGVACAGVLFNGALDPLVMRQIVVMAALFVTTWVLYMEASQVLIMSYRASVRLLILYLIVGGIFLLSPRLHYELFSRWLLPGGSLTQFGIGSTPRCSFLQSEPRVAAAAIGATLMPLPVARCMTSPTGSSYAVLAAGIICLLLTHCLTGLLLVLLITGLLVAGSRVMLGVAIVINVLFFCWLASQGRAIHSHGESFFTYLARWSDRTSISVPFSSTDDLAESIDQSAAAVDAFVSAPGFGLGVGGFGRFYLQEALKAGTTDPALRNYLRGDSVVVPGTSNFPLRIAGEAGVCGLLLVLALLGWLGWFAYRPAPAQAHLEQMALRYTAAAMIVSFLSISTLLNPFFFAIIVLLGQFNRAAGVSPQAAAV